MISAQTNYNIRILFYNYQGRKNKLYIKIVNKTIKEIEKSDFIRDLWIAYSNTYKYANDIEFIEIMEKIREIVNLIKY